MKIRLVGVEFLHADRPKKKKDRHDEPINRFSIFAEAPKMS